METYPCDECIMRRNYAVLSRVVHNGQVGVVGPAVLLCLVPIEWLSYGDVVGLLV